MTDEPTPHPDEQPAQHVPYSEVPPSLQEYVSAMTGNDYILFQLWNAPTVPHPQGREAMA